MKRALGILGLVEFLPALVLVLVTGTVADRFDRRRIASIGIFFEAATNVILDDLVAACQPKRMTVVGDFAVRGGMKTILVLVPLAELFGYATELRSRSQGRAAHSPMQLHAYSEVPFQVAKEIIARVTGE